MLQGPVLGSYKKKVSFTGKAFKDWGGDKGRAIRDTKTFFRRSKFRLLFCLRGEWGLRPLKALKINNNKKNAASLICSGRSQQQATDL